MAKSSPRYANETKMTTQVSSTPCAPSVGPLDDVRHQGDQRAPGDEEVCVQHGNAADRGGHVEHRQHRIAEQHQTEQAERREALPAYVELLHLPLLGGLHHSPPGRFTAAHKRKRRRAPALSSERTLSAARLEHALVMVDVAV